MMKIEESKRCVVRSDGRRLPAGGMRDVGSSIGLSHVCLLSLSQKSRAHKWHSVHALVNVQNRRCCRYRRRRGRQQQQLRRRYESQRFTRESVCEFALLSKFWFRSSRTKYSLRAHVFQLPSSCPLTHATLDL